MKRGLFIGDGVTPTGFSRVIHSIIGCLPQEDYEIHHLAINYKGDPHGYPYAIYPAFIRGDIYGFNRIQEFATANLDFIFILNDLWVINQYLDVIKKTFKEIPKVVIYFPVDGFGFDEEWFSNFDIVTKAVVYTKFGYDVCKAVRPDIDFEIIPHGVDGNTFNKLDGTKEELKKKLYPNDEQYYNSFIVLNAARNQPRKRIDIAFEGFALFAQDKPINVKYHHHAGVEDVGWNITKLAKRFNMEDRLILTNLERGVQKVSDAKLNLIYNATDVGLNTSLGEGLAN